MQKERLGNDQYFTNQKILEPLFKHIDLFASCNSQKRRPSVWEPCCGRGDLAEGLFNHGCAILASDIDPGLGYADFIHDARSAYKAPARYDQDCWGCPDWVITNPPYQQPDCQEIIENCWNACDWGMAMLLRLTYLEPCKNRVGFLRSAWLSHLIILNPRPRFRVDSKGTDSCTVAWFVWQKNTPEHRFTQIINANNWDK